MKLRHKIDIGDRVFYKNKPHIVISVTFECGGDSTRVGIIKLHEYWSPILRIAKYFSDEEIDIKLIPYLSA